MTTRALVPEDLHRNGDTQRRSFTRAITALALSSGQGRGAESLLRRTWPGDTMAETVLKSAVSPTGTGDYRTAVATNPLVTLAPASAAAQLFAECVQVDSAGATSVRLPYLASMPQPGFVGEMQPAPVVQLSIAGVEVGPARKILVLASVSGTLETATPQAASTMVGKALADAVTKAVDAAAFSNVAGDANRPPGLLYNVTPISAATAGGSDLETASSDLAALAKAIATANISPENMVIVAAWPQAMKLRLVSGPNFEHTIVGTSALADRTVVGVAGSGVGFGYVGTPEIAVSKEAAVHYEDVSPAQIGTAGSPNVVAAPTRSAFQHDLLVIKVRAKCAWDNLPGSVQMISGTNW